MLYLTLTLKSVWDFLEYGQIKIRAPWKNLICMWGEGHQWGEIFYDEEITRNSRQSIEKVSDSIEEVPEKVEGKKEHNYPSKRGKLALDDKSTSQPQ